METLIELEKQLLNLIRLSDDPDEAMDKAVRIILKQLKEQEEENEKSRAYAC